MTKRFALVAALIALAVPLPALASDRYFGLSAGAWLPAKTTSIDNSFQPTKSDYKTGWSAGGTVGVALDGGLRLENELTYRQAQVKGSSDDQWVLGWLVNIWYDLKNSSPLTPYVGGGFGYGRGRIASSGPISGEGNGVAYQAGGGLDVRLNRRLSLDIGYRYFGIADLSGNEVGKFELAGSSIMAGVRFKF